MPAAHLLPCPSCARHIRETERACPFCQTRTSPQFRSNRPAALPVVRLGRAALLAWGTTLAATACNSPEAAAPAPVAPPPESDPAAVLTPIAAPTPPEPEPPPAVEPPPEVVADAPEELEEPEAATPMRRRRRRPDPIMTGAPVAAYGAPSF